ncbi:alpha/beta hydrolase, partial [Pseudomonas fragi]|nr:alpha/beta hydrolase [Pseudomonas sp. GC01]
FSHEQHLDAAADKIAQWLQAGDAL